MRILDLYQTVYIYQRIRKKWDGLNENGNLIITTQYNSLIEFNSQTGHLKCESGISINEILNVIVPQGWFLIVPGTSFISVGGAIANDIHGNHHKFGTFGNSIIEIELLRSNGEVLKCSEKENYEFFKATMVVWDLQD